MSDIHSACLSLLFLMFPYVMYIILYYILFQMIFCACAGLEWLLLTADSLSSYSRKSTGVTNNINNGGMSFQRSSPQVLALCTEAH